MGVWGISEETDAETYLPVDNIDWVFNLAYSYF